jgi:hypothetical protein
MRKANDIRMSCNRASQLRSLSLIGFLLCQSLQSVVSLPAILSDVEVASKLRAEPVMELSKSGHTSEKAVESLSTDQLKVPKTNTQAKWGQCFSMIFAAPFPFSRVDYLLFFSKPKQGPWMNLLEHLRRVSGINQFPQTLTL